jgi:hypothetical protein
MATDQFDNYQVNPNTIGDDWVFSGDQAHMNRAPRTRISNFNYYFTGPRMTTDRTKTVFGYAHHEALHKTDGSLFETHDGYLGHGVDWGMFNYNPYGRQGGGLNQNPNFRVLNDWLQITGLGNISVVTDDVMDQDEVNASGMVQYRNYPTEGWNSFGKKYDKRWVWQGNTWVPSS